MKQPRVAMQWQEPERVAQSQTAVCLHGHTMHSEECLSFLPTYLRHVPGISQIVRQYESGPKPVDFSRAFWTPPLPPHCALRLEQSQIAKLGLRALVSLTDHDSIESGIALRITEDSRAVPISVEWTVPYERSIFHLGIHNLPSGSARAWAAAMAAFTAAPEERRLPQILRDLSAVPEVLVVLNHPFWLEEGVRQSDHDQALARILLECNQWFHAFELNGTRRWSENSAVIDLARQWGRPVLSGGDRHACEPSACLNLTDAATFSEFVAEIRSGQSSILFMSHYREPMPLRVLEASRDILRDYPEYPGREHWTGRIFYRGQDGIARPLSAVWNNRVPWILRPANGLIQFFAASGMKTTLRYLFARWAEALP